MTRAMDEARSLRVLTWNLEGLETTRLDSRAERICHELLLGMDVKQAMAGKRSPPMPEVVCLQEVVPRVHVAKLRPHLSAAGFGLWPEAPPREEGDYVLIAARPPWRIVDAAYRPFDDSPLGRGWVEALLEREGGARALVLTAHLESLRSGAESRVAQVRQLDARLHEEPDVPALFAGDTNLRKAEWDEAGAAMTDAWVAAGSPARHRDTWWPPEAERGLRFDRVWLDTQRDWEVSALRTRRRERLSDHAALEARLGF